jgi:hypothetical protein
MESSPPVRSVLGMMNRQSTEAERHLIQPPLGLTDRSMSPRRDPRR